MVVRNFTVLVAVATAAGELPPKNLKK